MSPGETKLLATVLVSVFSASVAVWAWLMRRWVAKVDTLHRDLESLRLQAAVKDERLTHIVGALELLRKSVADQTANVGSLSKSVDKMWTVLQAKGVIEARHSDEVLGNIKVGT